MPSLIIQRNVTEWIKDLLYLVYDAIIWDYVSAGMSSGFFSALSPDKVSAISPSAIRLLSPDVIEVGVFCLSGGHKQNRR